MVRLNPPSSTAVVDVPDESVEKFLAAGWVKVKARKPVAGPVKAEKSEESE